MDPMEKPSAEEQRLIDEIADGRRRMQDLPTAELGARRAAEIRRRALEAKYKVRLEHLGRYTLDAERVSARHCENLIGAVQIPVGLAGPLTVRGAQVDADEELFVPLATTEGALIASVSRGCRAIREAGGAVVNVEDVGVTRAPVFRSTGVEQTAEFLDWIYSHQEELREAAQAESRFLRLKEIRHQVIGTSIYLRFRFLSGDAMGMNMATIACDRMVTQVIEPATGVPCVALSGNFCVDKKPSAVNFLEGRGKRVHAEVVLDGKLLRETLKTSAAQLIEVQYRKNLLGSIAAGAMAFNAHYANVLSAFFLATGQDPAQVVEGAMGVTCIEPRGPEGVYASVFLPDLPLGAVGGGTALATQAEAMALLGIDADAERPGEAVLRLAEILGAAVLAGELSLLAAFTSSDLASAHERLGRGPVPGGE